MINLNVFVVLLTLLQGDVTVAAGAQGQPVFDEPEISTPKDQEPVIEECAEWPLCPPDDQVY